MQPAGPRYSKSEHARLGREIYERRIREQVETQYPNMIVAIDVNTGEFEVAETMLFACDRLKNRLDDPQIWCVRIGHSYVHQFGASIKEGT